MEDLRSLGIGVVGSVLAMVLGWLFNRSRVQARLRAEAYAAWKAHAASSIKGDGFSALFHLHRALHCRLCALAWLIGAGVCAVCTILTISGKWWAYVPYFLALQYCIFRASYLAAKATGMVEVAEEAVQPHAEQRQHEGVSEKAP